MLVPSAHRIRIESELGHNVDLDPGARGKVLLTVQGIQYHRVPNGSMALRMPCHADPLDAGPIQQTRINHVERAGELPERALEISCDEQSLLDAGFEQLG